MYIGLVTTTPLATTALSLLWYSWPTDNPDQRPASHSFFPSLFLDLHFHEANMPKHRHSDRTYQLDPTSPNLEKQGGTYVPTGMTLPSPLSRRYTPRDFYY